ncbi:MAG: DUF1214 domain-containing protein [Candidatus Hydrogenedentota bacterium]|nr:MAG: DUF1214 domain-containing protein [Candidatus Hydrogenedentota bacterium]
MYNVIQKNAMFYGNLTGTSGWNISVADTELKDHNFKTIARPNNDTLYCGCLLDLRNEPVIIEYPAFDSKYVVLETSAYDHYCDIPLSTTKGDFREPTKILYYTARTKGYSGEAIEGIDTIMEMSGDFAIAFVRVMPHAVEPERLQRNLATMKDIKTLTLSEYKGKEARPADTVDFPAVGSDFEVFENNFLEVMQFVFNHTTFDPEDIMDQAILAAIKPLGVEPGKDYDPDTIDTIDGGAFGEAARQIAHEQMALAMSPEGRSHMYDMFLPKGQMSLEVMLLQSVTGPIGVPAHQAVYPAIVTSDGVPMNAQQDYVIRMSKEEIPPARAFWSITLYDTENGFFIPNDRKKYSVGENAGMKLNEEGGIVIYIAAEQPKGVPDENWLPINRKDEALDIIMRIYDPDLERMKTWEAPKAEKID